MAFELNRNLDGDRLVVEYFEKVDVKDVVLYRVELDVLEDSVALLAVDSELYSEDVGGVHELAYILSLYNEVSSDDALAVADFNDLLAGLESSCEGELDDAAAVEHNGDEVVLTEFFCSLLAQIGAGFGVELKCFHFFGWFKWLCYSKLSDF